MLPHNAGLGDAGESHRAGDNERGSVFETGSSLAVQCAPQNNKRHSANIESRKVHQHACKDLIGGRVQATLDRRGNDNEPTRDVL